MEIEETYVLEFSPEKKSFHVSKLEEMIIVNKTNYDRDIFVYYIPIALGTWDAM